MKGTRPNCPNKDVFRTVRQTEVAESDKPRVQQYEPASSNETDSSPVESESLTKLALRMAYRARPLDGIWATGPYLHNGSVPNLDEMLLPAGERSKVFCVGSRQFDPVKIGIALDTPARTSNAADAKKCAPGLTRLDTRHLGSSNAGHSFEYTRNGKCEVRLNGKNHRYEDHRYNVKSYAPGVLGPWLCPDARAALIEYLKTL